MYVEPKKRTGCGPPVVWCANCKAEVDTMRVNMTFLWMSDILHTFFILEQQLNHVLVFVFFFLLQVEALNKKDDMK